jgi:hypothetical protein
MPSMTGILVDLAMAIVYVIVYLRVISTISRWIALGPGRAATRAIVGTFLLSMLYALFIGMRQPFVGGSLGLDDMAWIAYPIPFLLTGWGGVAALGERDIIGDRTVAQKSFGLRDALVALGLFGIAAAAFRFAIGPGGAGGAIDTSATDVLCWGSILSLVLLIAVWIDAAVRTAFGRRFPVLLAVSGIGTAAMTMVVSMLIPDIVLPIVGVFAVCYAGLAIAQETLLHKFGVRTANVRQLVGEES